MGMFTCIRFVGKLKKEYIEEIKSLFTTEAYNKNPYLEPWKEFAKNHSFAEAYSKLERAWALPFCGFSAYNYGKFSNKDFFDRSKDPSFSSVDEYYETWIFQCDLKDYDDEIETFLRDIAPQICKKFVAEVWYEEDDFPKIITFNAEEGE